MPFPPYYSHMRTAIITANVLVALMARQEAFRTCLWSNWKTALSRQLEDCSCVPCFQSRWQGSFIRNGLSAVSTRPIMLQTPRWENAHASPRQTSVLHWRATGLEAVAATAAAMAAAVARASYARSKRGQADRCQQQQQRGPDLPNTGGQFGEPAVRAAPLRAGCRGRGGERLRWATQGGVGGSL